MSKTPANRDPGSINLRGDAHVESFWKKHESWQPSSQIWQERHFDWLSPHAEITADIKAIRIIFNTRSLQRSPNKEPEHMSIHDRISITPAPLACSSVLNGPDCLPRVLKAAILFAGSGFRGFHTMQAHVMIRDGPACFYKESVLLPTVFFSIGAEHAPAPVTTMFH